MPGSSDPADLVRQFQRLVKRVEDLERRRPDVGTPVPLKSCVCPDNEGLVIASGTETTSTSLFAPTWTPLSTVGTGIFPNSGDIETTESGLYAISAQASFDAGATTLDVVELRVNENSLATQLMRDVRPGAAVSVDGSGTKTTVIELAGVFPIPANGRIDCSLRARSVNWNYTVTLLVCQVSRYPTV